MGNKKRRKAKKIEKTEFFNFSLHNLRTKIVVLILVCWLVPVTVLGLTNTVLYNISYRDKIDSSVVNELSYAAMFTADKIETLAKNLSNETYLKDLRGVYSNYKFGGYTQRETTISLKYFLSTRFPVTGKKGQTVEYEMADIVFSDAADYHYYNSNLTLGFWDKYLNEVYPQILEKSAGMTDEPIVYVNGDDIYICKKFLITDSRDEISTNSEMPYMMMILKLRRDVVFEYMLDNHLWESNVVFSINDQLGYLDETARETITAGTLERRAKAPAGVTERFSEYVVIGGTVRQDILEFKYAAMIKNNIIYAENSMFRYILVLIFVVLIPVLVLTTYYIYSKIDKPIKALVKGTRKIQNRELGAEIKYKGDDEFGYLIESFNDMSKTLKELFERSYKEELVLKDTKILALQSQINPHFLNNTLELMNWKARMCGDESLSKMIQSLSVMLDAGMNREKRKFIELAEEMESVDAYLYIIAIRFGKRITIEIDIDPDVLDVYVPPLVLQPLIENAVTHGIEPVYSGTIKISGYMKGDALCLEVENDGKELTASDLEKIRDYLKKPQSNIESEFENENKHYRLGIRNVDERIRLLYGESYGLSIEKLENGNTLNRITMPISHKE